jgi:hypothetical protein
MVEDKLKGWANIAKYMGQSTSTVQHWVKSGMPVAREGRSVSALKQFRDAVHALELLGGPNALFLVPSYLLKAFLLP